jgi:hypothetical protein
VGDNPSSALPPVPLRFANGALHPDFAAALATLREAINQRIAAVRLQGTAIDGPALLAHVRERIQPVAVAVAETFPERLRAATWALLEVSLELFQAGYWGRTTTCDELDELWEKVLPAVARHVARDPQRVAAALSNAVLRLATGESLRAAMWLRQLRELGAECQSVDELLEVGQILAWRSGMPQLRSGALAKLRTLRVDLAVQTLGCCPRPNAAGRIADHWQTLLGRLESDVWFDPAPYLAEIHGPPVEHAELRQWGAAAGEPRLMHMAGAFRGYGGAFLAPPILFEYEQAVYVSDRVTVWRIGVDLYGTYLHRVGEASDWVAQLSAVSEGDWPIWAPGRVLHWLDGQRVMPAHIQPASHASAGQVHALTLVNSFHVYLFSRGAAVHSAATALHRASGMP